VENFGLENSIKKGLDGLYVELPGTEELPTPPLELALSND